MTRYTPSSNRAYRGSYRNDQKGPNYYLIAMLCMSTSATGAFALALYWWSPILLLFSVLIVAIMAMLIIFDIEREG